MITYIAEIAGKDSIAAIHKFIQENHVDSIIPTIVYTGTEYGDTRVYYDSIEYLSHFSQKHGVCFKQTVSLQDEKLWNYLCVRYQYQMYCKYGFYTPCIMCHLFTHLMRIPILISSNSRGIITGERYCHDGTIKVNQHPATLKCFHSLMEKRKIFLVQPLLKIKNTNIINKEIEDFSKLSNINDVKCILSGNLNGFSLSHEDSLKQLQNYLDGYIFPVGEYILDCFIREISIQYDVLENIIQRSLQ